MSRFVTINSRDFGGEIRKSWKAELIEQREGLITLLGVFELEVDHPLLGVIRRGTVSYEYYWLDRWYNVFRFHEPDGAFRNYYCNVNMPPTFDGQALNYVDLDMDILVGKDGRYTILDVDEFEENAARFGLSPEIRANAEAALGELISLIEHREFPFERQYLQQSDTKLVITSSCPETD